MSIDIEFNVIFLRPTFRHVAKMMVHNQGKCLGWDGECDNPGTLRRQNTSYADEDSNWNFLCKDCQKQADEHWSDMWADYYRETT
jgi:hypothetical protein